MIKFITLSLAISFSQINLCQKNSFDKKNIITSDAVNFIKTRYRKEAENLYLFEILEVVSYSLIQFFDTENNHESFDTHVKRLYSFQPLIHSKLRDKERLLKDFENHYAEYNMEFGEMINFNEFQKSMIELNKHYNTFCTNLIDQTIQRSPWKICNLFYEFKRKLPERFFRRTSKITGVEISPYKIWTTIRLRLSIKD